MELRIRGRLKWKVSKPVSAKKGAINQTGRAGKGGKGGYVMWLCCMAILARCQKELSEGLLEGN